MKTRTRLRGSGGCALLKRLAIAAYCILPPAAASAQSDPAAQPDGLSALGVTSPSIAPSQPGAPSQFGGPPPPAGQRNPAGSLEASVISYSPEDLRSHRTGLRGDAALGSVAGLQVRGGGEVTHIYASGGGYFPGDLYKTAFNLTAEDRKTRLSVNLNSNSDNPFHSPSETDLGFNFLRTFSENGPHAWIYGLNYSTMRTFSRSVPIPFITYRYSSGNFFFLFPFLARWQPSREFSFSASYHPVKYYRLRADWRPSESCGIGLEGGTGLEQFLLSGRPRRSEALYYETSFIFLKPEFSLSRRLRLGAELGWQFSGLYYTGEAYDDHHGKTRAGSGPSAGLSAGYGF